MRKAFADTLLELANQDNSIILLTGDLGFGVFDQFKEAHPSRFINVGICEGAMVDIATGLAMEGYRPICYSIASFLAKAWEQVKVGPVYHQLPMVIVGAGGGYCYSTAGTTHHAAEDLGLFSLLPDMVVTCPGCPSEVSSLLKKLVAYDGPSYMRIGRYGEPNFESNPLRGARFGASRLRCGSGASIISTGDISGKMLDIIGPSIYHFPVIKPLDTLSIVTMEEPIVVVEEHSPYGGLYAAIMATGLKKDVVRIGPDDALLLDSIDREELHKRLGMDVESIQQIIWEAVTDGRASL